ncbi:histidine kinase [Spirosoma pomorum]
MKRIRLLLLLFAGWPLSLYAQINWGDYSQSYPDQALNKPQTVALILAIPKLNNSFWTRQATSPLFERFAKDATVKETRLTESIARTSFDTARAQFFLHGVNQGNAADYQYRVVEYPGRRILEPWRAITRFTDSSVINSSTLPQMAYLGGYKAPLGRMVVVDVRRQGQTPIIATSLVAWEPIRPTVSNIYTSDDLDVFLQKLQYPWVKSRTDNQAPAYSLTELKLAATNSNLVYKLTADIYSKTQLQYQLLRDDQLVRSWADNEYDNGFIWLKGFAPGRYRLQIRYTAQPQHVAEYRFQVEPAWYQSIWFRLAMAGVTVLVIGLIIVALLLVRQRTKTQQETMNKEKRQLELRALYAQLNPHFVFNALSSIQGLVNQQDLKGANAYLADFARLMRESLAGGNREETSLQQEVQTMETYLKLEQLRFGFRYTIRVSDQLDVYTTSLPSLLWQPLLENAVKHGVALLQGAGQITLWIDTVEDTLRIRITDNGNGMPDHVSTIGYGLALTRDRIRLLNELNPEQPITLAFTKPAVGAEVTLIFSHWLA